jgi:hypothetical protein
MRVITFTIRFSYIFYLLHVASAVGDTLSLCDAEAKGKRILGFITGDLPDDQRSGFPDGIDEANFANDLKTQGWTFGSDANTGDVTGAIDMLGLDDSMAATIAVDNNQPAGDVPVGTRKSTLA